MNIIKAIVEKNKIEVERPYFLTTDNVASLHCQFSFSEDWAGYAKIAVFGNKAFDRRYAVDIPDNGLCIVPWESLQEDGYLLIGVYGTVGSERRITTNLLSLTLHESCYGDGETPAAPSPDLYQQWVYFVNDMCTATMEDAQATLAGANAAKAGAQTAQSKAETARTGAESARAGAEAAEQRAYDFVNIVDGGRPGQTRKLIADGGRPGGM